MGLHTDVAPGLGGEENSAASFRGGSIWSGHSEFVARRLICLLSRT